MVTKLCAQSTYIKRKKYKKNFTLIKGAITLDSEIISDPFYGRSGKPNSKILIFGDLYIQTKKNPYLDTNLSLIGTINFMYIVEYRSVL